MKGKHTPGPAIIKKNRSPNRLGKQKKKNRFLHATIKKELQKSNQGGSGGGKEKPPAQ